MSSSLATSPTARRALRILATVLAGIVVLVVANTARGSQESGSPLEAQSLLTLPALSQPEPTPIATTAPLVVPTASPTPAPTATSVPTPAPTATAVPLPATPVPATPVPATPLPEPAAAEEDTVSVASGGSTAVQAEPTAPVVETPTLEPTATPQPTQTPVVAEAPAPSPTAGVVAATPEPTPEPTPTPTPIPLQTAAQLEAYVLGEINDVRARAGLGPITLDPVISQISRDWSQQMARGGFFDHRPGDQLNVMLPSGWRQWGENIASAPDIFYAQSSLENSAGHYANMVGPFTHVGIGVYTNGSQVWVTQNFVRY